MRQVKFIVRQSKPIKLSQLISYPYLFKKFNKCNDFQNERCGYCFKNIGNYKLLHFWYFRYFLKN